VLRDSSRPTSQLRELCANIGDASWSVQCMWCSALPVALDLHSLSGCQGSKAPRSCRCAAARSDTLHVTESGGVVIVDLVQHTSATVLGLLRAHSWRQGRVRDAMMCRWMMRKRETYRARHTRSMRPTSARCVPMFFTTSFRHAVSAAG
jgi:hypothetical protein